MGDSLHTQALMTLVDALPTSDGLKESVFNFHFIIPKIKLKFRQYDLDQTTTGVMNA